VRQREFVSSPILFRIIASGDFAQVMMHSDLPYLMASKYQRTQRAG
jgi:hypothetical protein